ncbi:MAG: hypothetical protein KC983_11360, partial [Phycisphaerales bacterium]|nr:hypothetical protein [Phycisphaerales bacterium]
RFLGEHVGAQIASTCADLGLAGQRMLLGAYMRRRTGHLRIETVDEAPREIDALLAQRNGRVVSHRSSTWMNWLLRIADPAEQREQRLCLVRAHDGHLVGAFMIRRRFHDTASSDGFRNVMLGSLKDHAVFDADQVDVLGLTMLALRELIAWGVDAAEVCATNDQDSRALRRLGLAQRGELHLVCHANPESPLYGNAFAERSAWWITPAEGDNFFN